jgi:hypothetical protein
MVLLVRIVFYVDSNVVTVLEVQITAKYVQILIDFFQKSVTVLMVTTRFQHQ